MRAIFAYIAAFIIFFVVASYAVSAFAADGGIAVQSFIDPLRPYVMEIVSIVAAGLVGYVARRVNMLTGLNIEARHREALQSALENGARLAFDHLTRDSEGKRLPVGNAGVEAGVNYVLRSVPDAVRFFGLTPQRVSDLMRPKLLSIF